MQAQQRLHVDFTPTDTVNYNTASKNVTINVIVRATPTITWNNPADITYGTAIEQHSVKCMQLKGHESVPGTLTYNPAAGTVLNAGTQELNVDFTPTDTANYNCNIKGCSNQCPKATPTITWSNPADITYGTALRWHSVKCSSTDSWKIITGTFFYTPAAGTVLNAGTQTLHVDFTPTDTANYTTASMDVTINILPPTAPVITPTAPVPTPTAPVITPTAPVPTPTAPVITPTAPVITPTAPVITPTAPVITPTVPLPTVASPVTTPASSFTTPVVDFSSNVTSGNAPLKVQFNDLSTGNPTAWQWDFNSDGVVDSSEKNPVCEFTYPGNYNVTLIAGSGTASGNITKINYITVGGGGLQAGFTASPVQGNAPLPVQFTDNSTGNVTSWLWDFGDGTISSEQNPTHTYSGPGSYSVTLNASNMDENSVLTLSAIY